MCRKEIEKIKLEQQNLKELLEKLSQKVDQILEQLVKETSKLEIENIFQQFEKLSLGEKPKSSVEFKINPFEPRNLEVKPWKL